MYCLINWRFSCFRVTRNVDLVVMQNQTYALLDKLEIKLQLKIEFDANEPLMLKTFW